MEHPSPLYKADGSYLDPEDPRRKVRKVLKKRKGDKRKTHHGLVKPETFFLRRTDKLEAKDELVSDKGKVKTVGKEEVSNRVESSGKVVGIGASSSTVAIPIIESPKTDEKIPEMTEVSPKSIEMLFPVTEEAPDAPPPSIKQPSPVRVFYAETPSSDYSDGIESPKMNEGQVELSEATQPVLEEVEEEAASSLDVMAGQVSSNPNGGALKKDYEKLKLDNALKGSSQESSESSSLGKMYFPGDPSDDSSGEVIITVEASKSTSLPPNNDSNTSNTFPVPFDLLKEAEKSSKTVDDCPPEPSATALGEDAFNQVTSGMETLSISNDDNLIKSDPSVAVVNSSMSSSIPELAEFLAVAHVEHSGYSKSVSDWVSKSEGYHGEKSAREEHTSSCKQLVPRTSSNTSSKKSAPKEKHVVGAPLRKTDVATAASSSISPLSSFPTSSGKSLSKSGVSRTSSSTSRSRPFPGNKFLTPEKYVDDVAPPPKGFPGRLADRNEDGQEYWRRCPYDKSHTYLRPMVHLTACRDKYLEKCRRQGKEVDIEICRHTYEHHIPVEQLAEHEAKCEFGSMLHTYLVQWAKDERVREAMARAKANAPPQ